MAHSSRTKPRLSARERRAQATEASIDLSVPKRERRSTEPVRPLSYAEAINASADMLPMLPGETMAAYATRALATMKEAQPA